MEDEDIDTVQSCLDRQVVLSQKNKWGLTALHMAAACGVTNIVQLLLTHNAPCEAVTVLGWYS